MKFEGQTILLISNEPWGDIWFSKHHLAYALSKKNKVYFVNAPEKWKLKNVWSTEVKETFVSENLWVLNYFNILPLTGRLDLLFRLNNKLVCAHLNNFLKKKHAGKIIFLSFDPIRLLEPKLLNPTYSIYYTVDNYFHVPREKILATKVDMILGVSEMLVQQLKPYNTNIHFLPHGIQETALNTEQILKHPMQKEVLYIGSVNYRLNYRLLIDLAKNIPDHQFKIVGALNTARFLPEDHEHYITCKQIPNIEFTGPMPFSNMEGLILRAAACISFYKQDYISNKLNSLKLLQYLSYGKPVISNYFESYKNIQKDIIYLRDDKDVLDTLKHILNTKEPNELKIARINFAQQFTYPKLIQKIEQFITKPLP